MNALLPIRLILRQTAPWLLPFGALMTVVFGAVGVGAGIVGQAGTYASTAAHWGVQWGAFAGGIALGGTVPVLVAHGLTRHRAAVGAAGAVAGLAAGLAVIHQVGLLVEAGAHRLAGSSPVVDGPHLFSAIGQVHLILAEYALLYAAFVGTGWLVFTVYYRVGGRWGTVALPLSALPMLVAFVALPLGWVGPVSEESPPWVATTGVGPALALALAAAVAALVAAYALTRQLAISTK